MSQNTSYANSLVLRYFISIMSSLSKWYLWRPFFAHLSPALFNSTSPTFWISFRNRCLQFVVIRTSKIFFVSRRRWFLNESSVCDICEAQMSYISSSSGHRLRNCVLCFTSELGRIGFAEFVGGIASIPIWKITLEIPTVAMHVSYWTSSRSHRGWHVSHNK